MNLDDVKIYDLPEMFEKFKNEYFALNQKGDIMNAWGHLKSQAMYGSKDSSGEPITIDALIKAYKEYLNYWNKVFGDKDEKFISKEDRLADPEYFILFKMYCSSWKTTASPRDAYLFGDYSAEYMKQKTEEFRNGRPKKKTTTK